MTEAHVERLRDQLEAAISQAVINGVPVAVVREILSQLAGSLSVSQPQSRAA